MARLGALLAACALAALCSGAVAAPGQRLLVLLDDPAMEQSHSRFLGALKARGYQVDARPIASSALQLKSWDEWLYDKVAILGGAKSLGGALDVAQLVAFVDSGRDLLLAAGSDVSEELRELAQELGVDMDASGHAVIDHWGYDSRLGGEDHAAVLAAAYAPSRALLPDGPPPAPVLFRGVGLSVGENSETAFYALSGSPTAYSGAPGAAQTDAKLAGGGMALVALAQMRNNARVAVAGSTHMWSDEAWAATGTDRAGKSLGRVANEAFCQAVSKWAFQERGVLRASNLSHAVLAGAHPGAVRPERYRINDEVEFSVLVQECADGTCGPYKADDMQVELVMLDPYVRAPLRHDGAGRFAARVKLPDVYGVFKWVLDYRRPGYSYIELSETVPIRPFKHNEYERFIGQAFPYYASAASMMAGFLALGALLLWTK